jgi:hypothetical protein
MHTDPHDDDFERPGRLPHEIEQGLADASHVDNASRPDDPTDDAEHEHRDPWCDSCGGPYDGWLEQYGGHWDTCPNRVLTAPVDAFVTRPDLDAPSDKMTVDQFREAVGVERASHAARGYDEAHDRAHGVPHLLRWAIDYASRGEAVKSGALIVAALNLAESLEREERGARRTIADERARADQSDAVIEAVKQWRVGLGENYAGPGGIIFDFDEVMESASPTAEHGAEQ